MELSIIIPVYNSENYLADCLDSCLNQTLRLNEEYEVICVNDGSTDNTDAILRRYEQMGVIVIAQKNKGVSAARNNGLRNAKGDYVWFVDSDDCIYPSCLTTLCQEIRKSHVTGYGFLRERVPYDFNFHDVSKDDRLINIKWVYDNQLFEYVFTNVISRDYLLVNSCFFNEEMPYHEDYLWAVNVMMHHATFLKTSSALYYYRNNPTSAMGLMQNNFRKWQKSRLILIEELQSLLQSDVLKNNSSLYFQVQSEIRWSIPQIMDGTARSLSYIDCIKLTDNLKRIGVYPYPVDFKGLFHRSSLRELKYKLFTLLFPFESYYKLYSRIYSRSNK